MQVGSIHGVDFRNYLTLDYTPAPRLNILTGPNGQGKTNLLEALGMLVAGRSFRTPRTAEIVRWGAGAATISGELARDRAASQRSVHRTLTRLPDGRWQNTGTVAEWARAIAFGWQDLEIVNGVPAARRNFIDGFAGRLSTTHLPTLVRYREVLACRNRLLQGRPGESEAARQLGPWDEQLAEVGTALVGRRRQAIAALQSELARLYRAVSTTRAKVEVRYRTAMGESSEAETLLALLHRTRRHELRRGLTLVGPHRDDLAIEIDGVDARAFGSRGQQRLIALALRLAEVLPVMEATGTAPVLLLDDALSELDPAGRDHVLQELSAAEQVFLATPEPLAVRDAAVFQVTGGRVTRA